MRRAWWKPKSWGEEMGFARLYGLARYLRVLKERHGRRTSHVWTDRSVGEAATLGHRTRCAKRKGFRILKITPLLIYRVDVLHISRSNWSINQPASSIIARYANQTQTRKERKKRKKTNKGSHYQYKFPPSKKLNQSNIDAYTPTPSLPISLRHPPSSIPQQHPKVPRAVQKPSKQSDRPRETPSQIYSPHSSPRPPSPPHRPLFWSTPPSPTLCISYISPHKPPGRSACCRPPESSCASGTTCAEFLAAGVCMLASSPWGSRGAPEGPSRMWCVSK